MNPTEVAHTVRCVCAHERCVRGAAVTCIVATRVEQSIILESVQCGQIIQCEVEAYVGCMPGTRGIPHL